MLASRAGASDPVAPVAATAMATSSATPSPRARDQMNAGCRCCRWRRCSQRRPHLRGSPRSILALSLMRRPLLRHARDTPNRPTNSAAKRSPVASIPSLSNTAGWENASAVAGGGGSGAKLLMAESSCGAAGAHRLLLLLLKILGANPLWEGAKAKHGFSDLLLGEPPFQADGRRTRPACVR